MRFQKYQTTLFSKCPICNSPLAYGGPSCVIHTLALSAALVFNCQEYRSGYHLLNKNEITWSALFQIRFLSCSRSGKHRESSLRAINSLRKHFNCFLTNLHTHFWQKRNDKKNKSISYEFLTIFIFTLIKTICIQV